MTKMSSQDQSKKISKEWGIPRFLASRQYEKKKKKKEIFFPHNRNSIKKLSDQFFKRNSPFGGGTQTIGKISTIRNNSFARSIPLHSVSPQTAI